MKVPFLLLPHWVTQFFLTTDTNSSINPFFLNVILHHYAPDMSFRFLHNSQSPTKTKILIISFPYFLLPKENSLICLCIVLSKDTTVLCCDFALLLTFHLLSKCFYFICLTHCTVHDTWWITNNICWMGL